MSASLNQGILDIALSGPADAVTLSGQGGQVRVFDGATTRSFAASSVTSINVHEDAITNPFVTATSSATFQGAIAAPGGIKVKGLDAITVAAGATLSTRGIAAGANPLTAPSTAASGDLALAARQITVAANAALLAQGDATHLGGAVTLATEDQVSIGFVPFLPFRDLKTNAGVDIADGATIMGRDVTATSFASTNKFVENLQETPADTRIVLLGDVNGDGRPDLLVANTGQPVRLFLNNGTTDPFAVTPLLVGPAAGDPTALALGDLDGDGRPDLVVGYDGAPVAVYRNDGSATAFANVAGVAVGVASPTTAVALGDFNGDGKLDLVVGGSDVAVREYLNDGSGGFGAGVALPGGAQDTTSLAVGDVNGDGLPDLVVGNRGSQSAANAATKANVLYTNLLGLGLAGPVAIGTDQPDTRGVALADLDGDGRLDLVLANAGGPSQFYLNQGPLAPFGSPLRVATLAELAGSDDARSVAVGDLDGDGKSDILLGIDGAANQVYRNAGNGTFAAAANLDASTSPTTSVAAGDVDGDGKVDVVVGTAGQGDFFYRNAGSGTFATPLLVTALDPQLTYTSTLNLTFGPLDLTGLTAFGGAVLAEARSHVTVGAAIIQATNRVSILANSVANAQITTVGMAVGVGIGVSTASSDVAVGAGARITAGGDFNLVATNNNTLFVSLVSPTLIPQQTQGGGNVTVGVGVARTHANAEIAPGATVTAGAANVQATNTNNFTVQTLNLSFQGGGVAVAGGSLVIADKASDARASVGGTLRTLGDVAINATSTNTKDLVASGASNIPKQQDNGLFRAVVGGLADKVAAIGNLVTKVADVGSSGKGQLLGKTLNLSHGSPQLGLAAGIALDLTSNTADAGIAAGADVIAGGALTVAGTASMRFQAAATASAGNAQTAAIGGSILIAVPTNTAAAHIDQGAQVDAAGTLRVAADAQMPNVVSYLNFRAYIPDPHAPETSDPKNIVADYQLANLPSIIPGNIITPILTIFATGSPIAGQLANTFTAAGGTGDGGKGSVGLSGSINALYQTNGATATIGTDARINQRFAAPLPPGQDVLVTANARLESIDPNGPITVLGGIGKLASALLGGSEGVGLGGTLFVGNFGNSAVAAVGDGARIAAGRDVAVRSTSFTFVVAAAAAGTQSSEAGFQGSASAALLDTTTTATLSNRATVVAGRDLTVDADSLLQDVNFTGGLVVSANVGVGVSAAVSLVTDTTTATIGGGDPSRGSPGSVTVGRDLLVKANGVRDVITVGIAAASAVGGNASTPAAPTDSSGPTDDIGAIGKALAAVKGKLGPAASVNGFGVEVNGTIAFNIMFTDTEAGVSGLASARVGGNATIDAASDAVMVGAGGGAVLGKNAGVGGEFVHNGLFQTTHAYLDGGTFAATGALAVGAHSDAVVAGAAAGGTISSKSFAGNGSAIVTPILVDTAAWIGGPTTATAGSVAVAADNKLRVLPIAGAAAVAAGVGGRSVASVGGAIAVTVIDETVSARIDPGASVAVTPGRVGNISVTATSAEDIVSLAASFAASPGGLAAANGAGVPLVMVQDINASIGAGAVVTTPGSVYVGATDRLNKVLIAGGAAGAQAGAVGASAVADIATRSITATVGNNATINAGGQGDPIPDDGSGKAHGLAVNAAAADKVLRVAANGAIAGGGDAALAAAGALGLGTSVSTVAARIGDGARINTTNLPQSGSLQSVRVTADHETLELGVTGGLAVAAAQTGAALGAAAGTSGIDKTVAATIGTGAIVRAQDSVLVDAASVNRLVGFTVGLAGSGTAAIAGSAQVYVLPTTVAATIGDGADVRARGNVRVAADNIFQVVAISGQAAVAAQVEPNSIAAALGAAATSTTITATTTARIGQGATVEGLGLADAIAAPTGAKDTLGNNATTPTRGVIVAATAAEDLATVAFGGSLAGANNGVALALAGSATANVLILNTTATVDQSAVINPDAANAGAAQDVVVLASDRTRNLTAAGALAATIAIPTNPEEPFAAAASGAAGADVLVVRKTTAAAIAASATVNAGDSVAVRTLSGEESLLVSLAAGVAAGPSLAIAGSAGVGVLLTSTSATIGAQARVTAQGNIQVAANDDTSTALGVGNAIVGGVGGGVSVGAFVITPTTTAAIGDGAVVIGRGLRDAMTIATGGYTATPTAYRAGTESFVPPSVRTSLPAGIDPGGTLTDRLGGDEATTADVASMRGVAVTANNQNVTRRFVVGAGLGGGAAMPVASVSAVIAQTHATVGAGAQVNPGNAGDGIGQSIRVAAGSDYSALTVSGAFSLGFVAAISPTADVAVLQMDTLATVGTGALMAARQDVTVAASASEDTLAIAAAGAGSLQGFAVAGTVTGVFITNTTLATIGAGATVRAGGNVVVSASDETRADVFVGAASYQGTGASIAATPVTKDTEASIGVGASVDALGNSPVAANVPRGTLASGQSAWSPVRGLLVQARSTETLFAIVATGNLGGFGLAGSINATVVDATTRAFIDSQAEINADSAGAVADQSVVVVANDAQKATTVVGTAVLGGVGIGGAADIGSYRSNTSAYVGDGAVVRARDAVAVVALGDKDVTSVVASAAIGSNSLGAAVSVLAVDNTFGASTARDPKDTQHNTTADWTKVPGGSGLGGAVDGQATGDGSVVRLALGKLGNYDTSDPTGQAIAGGAAEAQGRLDSALPGGRVAGAIARTDVPQGVVALIGNGADVRAGGNVVVDAEQTNKLTQGVGVLSVGLSSPIIPTVSLGASVAVAVIGSQTRASIGDDATVVANTGGGGGGVIVQSRFDEAQQSLVVTGNVNTGGYGLNAQVAIVEDSSLQYASTGDRAQIGGAAFVNLAAIGNRSLSVQAVGVGVAFQAAGGVSLASAIARGETKAFTGTGVAIGQGAGLGVGSVAITATATTPIAAKAIAVAGGVGGAGQGSVAIARALPVVAASFGASNVVTTTGTTAVTADWSGDQDANALGVSVAGSLAVGVSYARADANPNFVLAVVQAGTTIDAGQLAVTAGARGRAHAHAIAAAGAALVGGTGVIASTVASPTVRATIGTNAVVRAGSVALTTNTDLRAVSEGFGLSAAGLLGIGVVVVTAVVTPTVDTGISAGAQVTASGGITLAANHVGSAEADGTAPGVALATGSGAQTTATASAMTDTRIGAGATLSGASIRSKAVATNSATASSMSLNIGGIAVGANLATATADGTTRSDFAGNVAPVANGNPGDVLIAATSTDRADATADATSGGLLSGLGASATAEANPTIAAGIAANSRLVGIGNLTIITTTTTAADATANGLVVGLLGVGVTLATATASPVVQNSIGRGTTVQATGTVLLENDHNNEGSVGAQAQATNTAVGFAGVGFSSATANNNSSFATNLGDSAIIRAGGDVQLIDISYDQANALGDGRSYGVVAVGAVNATATNMTRHAVTVGQGASIVAGREFRLQTFVQDQGNAITYASTGGLIGGNGSTAVANSSPTVEVSVGNGTSLTTGGDVVLTNFATEAAYALANGTTVALAGVGTSSATSTASPTLTTAVGDGVRIAATGSIKLHVSHNPSGFSPTSSTALATGSAGGLVVSQGTLADARFGGSSTARVGMGGRLTAGEDVIIQSTSGGSVLSRATADSQGFIAEGGTNAYGNLVHVNRATVGGTIVAGGNFDLLADTTNDGDAFSSGSHGGLIGLSSVGTRLVIRYNSAAGVAANASITAGGELDVAATSATVAHGHAQTDTSGLGIKADVDSTVIVGNLPDGINPSDLADDADISDSTIQANYGAPTVASVGTGAQLRADNIDVRAMVTRANARSYNYVTSEAAAGSADGDSAVTMVVPALVRVTGATMTAPTVTLVAGYAGGTYGTGTDEYYDSPQDATLYNIGTAAYSSNYVDGGGRIGYVASVVHNAQFTQARVTTDAATTIATRALSIQGLTPQVSLNSRSTIAGGVTIGRKVENDYRRELADSSIDFNAHVVATPAAAVLTIGADGTVTRNQGFNVAKGGGITTVTGVSAPPTVIQLLVSDREVIFHSFDYNDNLVGAYQTHTISGSPTIDRGSFSSVQITDASSGTLRLGDFSLGNNSVPFIQVGLVSGSGIAPLPTEDNRLSLDNVAAAGASTSLMFSILKTGAGLLDLGGFITAPFSPGVSNQFAARNTNGDILVGGEIVFSGGGISLASDEGSINSAGGSLRAASIGLVAAGGVGANGTPLDVTLSRIDQATPSLFIDADGDANLSVQASTGTRRFGPALAIGDRTRVGGNFGFQFLGGRDGESQPQATPITLGAITVGGYAIFASQGPQVDRWNLAGPVRVGSSAIFAGGTMVDVGANGPVLIAQSAVLITDAIGNQANPLDLQVGQLATTTTGDQFLNNAGDLAIIDGFFARGLVSSSGQVNVATSGALTLGAQVAGTAVGLTAGSIAQTTGGNGVATDGKLTVRLRTGGAGSAGQPLRFRASQISLAADPAAAGDIYLAVDGRTSVQGIDALSESLWLGGGTFADETHINALATNLLAGTLLGNGTVSGPLAATGGTVAPGLGFDGALRTGPVTFQPGSTFQTLIDQAQVGRGIRTTVTPLIASGPVALNGATLAGLVSPGLVHGSRFTIITAAAVIGRFAQGAQVVLNGQTFQVVYNPTSVELVLDQAPVANAGGPYKINQGAALTFDGSQSSDPDGDPLTYSWTINGHAGAATGVNPTLTADQLRALGITGATTSFAVVLTVSDGFVSVNSAPVTVTVAASNVPATVVGVGLSWGTQSATLVAVGGGRWLPSGRKNAISWSNVNAITITLSNAATLGLGDLSIAGKSGASYVVSKLAISGSSVTISLAAPLTKADRLMVTLGNSAVATTTFELDILPGDINDDGVVNSADASAAQGMIAGSTPMSIFGDVNGDGVVDAKDTTFIRQKNGTRLP